MSDYRRQVWLVYGQTGSGKTILARALLEKRMKELGAGATGLVVDTLEEHADLPAIELNTLKNYLKIGVPENTRYEKVKLPRVGRVLLDDEDEFSTFSAILESNEEQHRPIVLMIDEVSYWSSPSKSTVGLSHLIRYGRHWMVDLIGVVRRPAETSAELRAQATELFVIGRIVEPRDYDYFKKVLPEPVMEKVNTLPEFSYIKYKTTGTYTICKPVKITG